MTQALIEKINKLKKDKNAVVLAHCYQHAEIDKVADFVGDSLYLSQAAAKTDADIIVFAGVFFMAETAKMLSPDKKVLLPCKNAGCEMADMINLQQIRELKAKNPNIPVVCYVNSSAEVKSEADYCCTSSNALKVVSAIGAKKVLFVPDRYLGSWVGNQLKDVEVITYNGFCPVHFGISVKDVIARKQENPDALVLAHPECQKEVVELADYVGSTTGIMKFAKESDNKTFIISTEIGVVERLERDCPDKKFVLVSQQAVCKNMKYHKLQDIYDALLNEQNEINVDENISKKAVKCIDRMLEISK
ncbi:MAG: quinolinate synthase NadA [bacterium]|nr:quinolinate synthase NadA [bacterium]